MPLVVSAPAQNVARLRFVTRKMSFLSRLIRFHTSGAVSHVEAVMSDGRIITSLIPGGVQRMPNDYDTSSTLQIFVDLHMQPLCYKRWEAFLNSRVGWPYDKLAIAEFATHFSFHTPGSIICSALQVDALRHCQWFPRPLSQKYHQISPVVLLLMLQAGPNLSTIVYPTENVTA
jgi:hypothetical protein